jgi:hypothetical protein
MDGDEGEARFVLAVEETHPHAGSAADQPDDLACVAGVTDHSGAERVQFVNPVAM